MIMAGTEFMGDIPFKDVYIHGTVRDITGTKMSKSLGNVIDPLDMIAKYGTDALRFSIISITAQGQDVFLSEGKFELGRNFANKMWNASRFILMNLKYDEVINDAEDLPKRADLTLPERWILSRFYSTLGVVGKCLDEYKFNEAANSIYEFMWHEFCDWYIETAKSTIEKKTTQAILYSVLEESLRMCHPFMPFVTEEIWMKLPRRKGAKGESIMTSPWPAVRRELIANAAEDDMKRIIELVTAVRNLRSVWNIEPRLEIKASVNTAGTKDDRLLNENAEFIKRLARISTLEIGKTAKPKNAACAVLSGLEIYLPLQGIIDFEKEKKRLRKEADRASAEAASINSRLKDTNFVSKAPEEVVNKQRERVKELGLLVKRLKGNLKEIGG